MNDCNLDVIKRTPVYKASLFDVEEYKIKLKTGKEVVHHVVVRHPTITVFPMTDKNELYLISQYRYLFGGEILEAVAGFIDEGENPLKAAKRELLEETGISASSWEEMTKLDMAASVIKAQNHIFLAKDLEFGTSHPEEDEDIKLVKLPLEKAVEKVLTGEITTASTVAGILMIERMMKKR